MKELEKRDFSEGNIVSHSGIDMFVDFAGEFELTLYASKSEPERWNVKYSEVEPIKINEQTLRRAGFSISGILATKYLGEGIGAKYLLYAITNNSIQLCLNTMCLFERKIKYAHTLQNFIYINMGEEIELT